MVQECKFSGDKPTYEYTAYVFSDRKHYEKIHEEIKNTAVAVTTV